MTNRKRSKLGSLAVGGAMLLACGSEEAGDDKSDDRCEEQSGVVCRWIGTGELGLSEAQVPRRESRLYWPLDLTFSPAGQAFLLDWNNHQVRKRRTDDTRRDRGGRRLRRRWARMDKGDLMRAGRTRRQRLAQSSDRPRVRSRWPALLRRLAQSQAAQARSGHRPRAGDVRTRRGLRGRWRPGCDGAFNQPKAIAHRRLRAPLRARPAQLPRPQDRRGAEPIISTRGGHGHCRASEATGAPAGRELELRDGRQPRAVRCARARTGRASSTSPTASTTAFGASTSRPTRSTPSPAPARHGYSGDGGPALEAKLNRRARPRVRPGRAGSTSPTPTTTSSAPSTCKTGMIETVVGTGKAGDERRGPACARDAAQPPVRHRLRSEAGDLYVADTFNSRILKVMR